MQKIPRRVAPKIFFNFRDVDVKHNKNTTWGSRISTLFFTKCIHVSRKEAERDFFDACSATTFQKCQTNMLLNKVIQKYLHACFKICMKFLILYCYNVIWPISDYTFFLLIIFIDHKVLVINLEPLLVFLFFVLVCFKTNLEREKKRDDI